MSSVVNSLAIASLFLVAAYILKTYYKPNPLDAVVTISPLSYLKSVFSGESNDLRNQKLVYPKYLAGDGVVKLWLGKWYVQISDYQLITKLLTEEVSDKLKTSDFGVNSLAHQFCGSNVAELDGKEWIRHRRVLNTNFKKGWDILKFEKVCKSFIAKVETESKDKEFDITGLLKRTSLDSLGLLLFDIDFNFIINDNSRVASLYTTVVKGLENMVYVLMASLAKNFQGYKRLERDIQEFRSLIEGLINTKKQQISEENVGDDLITSMLLAKDEDGKQVLLDKEIVDDTVVFFSAGNDTTAYTLSFALYYLAKHPWTQAKLRATVVDILGTESDGNFLMPSFEQLQKMDLLTAVIYEAMRLNPVGNLMFRTLNQNYNITNNIILPKGQSLLLDVTYAMQDPKLFPDPHNFYPQRFLNLDSSLDRSKAQLLLSFGYGKRKCLGQSFALIEMKLLLTALVQRFKWKLPADSKHHDRPILNSVGFLNIQDLKLDFERV